MASDEVQPVTAQQPIEGDLNVLITMSKEQILNLISATHLPGEENFDADSLLVAVKHEHQKYRKNYFELLRSVERDMKNLAKASFKSEEDVKNPKEKSDEEDMENLEVKMSIASFNSEEDVENPKEKSNEEDMENLEEKMSIASFNSEEDVENPKEKSDEEDMENLEEKMSIASFNSEEDVENPKEKGQENLEDKVYRDRFNPQLLDIVKELSSEMMACEAPSVELIKSILNKLSNYSWEAKLLLILVAYALNFKGFLDIPNNVPATLEHQKLRKMLKSFDFIIFEPLYAMNYFLEVKKDTKDEPALLLDVAADISVGVYWIILFCTTHMCCLTSDEDKTQDLSPLVNKIRSIFSDLRSRISRIDMMYSIRKLFARDAMQPLIDGSTIEQELIVNLNSETHLPDEENFDADSLIDVVGKIGRRALEIESGYNISSSPKGQENLKEKVSRDSINPQLLCIVELLLSEMECEAPSVEVIMSILNKLSNYSWDAKLVLILAAYAFNFENFLDIPNNVPAHSKHSRTFSLITSNAVLTLRHFWKVKKDTKDEPALLSDVAGDILVGFYLIIVTCTTHLCCLRSGEDKTQDLSPLVNKIDSIFFDLYMRIITIDEMYRRRKLKELFAKDAMQPLIDGATNKQVSIDVLKQKNILLFISDLNIHRNDKSDLMLIYDGIKKMGNQYKIVWIPIVEQWTDNLRRKFEILRSKMPWYIVQYFSAVAANKFIEERYEKPIVLLMNPEGEVENEDALDLIQRYKMDAFPFTPRPIPEAAHWRTPGPYEIEEYTFLYGGKDKRWIEQFYRKVKAVAEDMLIEKGNIIIEYSSVGKKSKDVKKIDKEIRKKLLRPFKNDERWAIFMTNFSEVISKDGTTILKVLEKFEEWKVNVHDRGFQICFKEYHDKLRPTHGSQPSASRNV